MNEENVRQRIHIQSREDSRRKLAELVLPPIVSAIFNGGAIHEALRYRCQSPSYVFAAQVEIPGGEITPLWECGVLVTAYQRSQPKRRFIRFSLESPEEVSVLGEAFTAVVADLLRLLWEDEVSEVVLRDVARSLGFHPIERLLSDLAATPKNLSIGEHQRWLIGMLASYDDGV